MRSPGMRRATVMCNGPAVLSRARRDRGLSALGSCRPELRVPALANRSCPEVRDHDAYHTSATNAGGKNSHGEMLPLTISTPARTRRTSPDGQAAPARLSPPRREVDRSRRWPWFHGVRLRCPRIPFCAIGASPASNCLAVCQVRRLPWGNSRCVRARRWRPSGMHGTREPERDKVASLRYAVDMNSFWEASIPF